MSDFCEKSMVSAVRRSLALSRNYEEGEIIQENDLIWIRPGSGFVYGQESLVIERNRKTKNYERFGTPKRRFFLNFYILLLKKSSKTETLKVNFLGKGIFIRFSNIKIIKNNNFKQYE